MSVSLTSFALPTTIVTSRLSVSAAPSTAASPRLPLPGPSSSSLQCQHFQSCSGCSHELDLDRPPALEEAAKFFKDAGVSDFTFDSCRLWEWRCRAKLAVRGTSDGPLIGLYKEGTHEVVDIPLCQAHHSSINAVVNLLKQGIVELNIQPYDEDLRTGELRYIQMAVTTYDTSIPAAERYQRGKVQVALVWNSRSEHSPGSEKLNALSDFLWRKGGPRSGVHIIHSIWVNFQTSSNNIIFGNRWRHLLGERDFWERIGGIDVSLAPSSFGQANTLAFDSLLRKLQKYVPFGSSVVDLYAGAGIIGLSVAVTRKCRAVKCIEINKESKISFEQTLSRLPKTVDSSISWHHADASIEPLHWLEGSDVIVVDPPRKGLDQSVIFALQNLVSSERKAANASASSTLKAKDEKRPWVLRAREASVHIESKTSWEESQSWPQTLIYISCGWESFKEDCRYLLSKKVWRLEKAHAFNFFPGTQSIEVLAVFKRGPRSSKKKKKSAKKKTPK
ncbi:hypothetical protein QJS04_geneDACA012650 [Acorus gramineus]|uniref:Methyltransferase small domain-containing protein n=1 Tax=Acorus gramineus TaxID=55184 RepID=A0AAV9B6V8_ACOGR|nr:hypothetical protein QJS04_geneDACA012650 [Acorus gramineus]